MTDENDVAKAQADAVKAVADTTSKAIGAAENTAGFFARFFEGPLQQASLIVEDTLRHKRSKRLLNFADEMQHEMAIRGMTTATRSVAMNFGLRVISAASVEDDNELQKRWARLLVNAGDADSGVHVERSFAGILENLSPLEAQILDRIYDAIEHLPSPDEPHYRAAHHSGMIDTSELPHRAILADASQVGGRHEPQRAIQIALWNLQRLGCFESEPMVLGTSTMARGWLTPLGVEFVRACRSRTSGTPSKG